MALADDEIEFVEVNGTRKKFADTTARAAVDDLGEEVKKIPVTQEDVLWDNPNKNDEWDGINTTIPNMADYDSLKIIVKENSIEAGTGGRVYEIKLGTTDIYYLKLNKTQLGPPNTIVLTFRNMQFKKSANSFICNEAYQTYLTTSGLQTQTVSKRAFVVEKIIGVKKL